MPARGYGERVHVVGRLALTWSNKDQALVSDYKGGYEWVDAADVRAAEVRDLDEVERVGDVAGTAADNLLINGGSRDALRSLIKTPEHAEQYGFLSVKPQPGEEDC